MTNLDFYFSPGCQWAWRTALWARIVREQRPLNITWKLFSLATVNKPHDPTGERFRNGIRAEKLLVATRREHGNEGIERLYMALGDAFHGRKEPRLPETLLACLRTAGLPEALLQAAEEDRSVEEELMAEHQHAVDTLGAFGVPTLHLEGRELGFFGPVVDPVPTGAEAVDLWDHTLWSLDKPYLWEFKRERNYQPLPQPFIGPEPRAAAAV